MSTIALEDIAGRNTSVRVINAIDYAVGFDGA
jgi:hypothetical protein